MSKKPDSKCAADETTVLNLKQFAPGHESAAPAPADEGLTVFIQRAAHKTAGESQPGGRPAEGGALPPEQMLGAVSYCYAKGVYQSEEIERKMLDDTAICEATGGEVPGAREIRKFRRLNRKSIQATLENAFHQQNQHAQAGAPAVSVAPATDGSPAAETHSVMISRRQAEDNLNQAAFIDNMLKED